MALGALAAGLGAVGGILGADSARSGATAAGDAQKAALAAYISKLDSVGLPPDQSALIILDQYKQAGILTPELEQQVVNSVSEYHNIKRDDASRNMQVAALKQMSQYGKAGLTPDERAEMRKSRQGVQQDLEAKQQQIIQNLAARGQGGAGAEIAARLSASQAGADRASEEGDRISSLAAQRALQAISSQYGMAGQLRSQDFGEDAAKADAADQMQRFNVQNQMAVNQRNVAAGNRAQEANLINAQDVSNKNVGQTNQEKYNQLNRQRQFWDDKLRYAQSYGQPLQAYGNAAAQQAAGESAARTQAIASGFGGLSTYLSGLGGGAPKSVKDMSFEEAEDNYDKQQANKRKGIGVY